ncbi:MAG TPA: response regulator, partial [Thermoanaerobaculia bacterium]|nr:response regulator [Thermoanaerobaculia bacterium]
FVVSLPALEAHAAEAGALLPAGQEPAAPPDLEGVRVMVVDDEPDAREIIGEILKGARASVSGFGSMDEALAGLEAAAPDVIVSDIAMPGGDGYALLKEIRRREAGTGRRVPAIALTAYVRREDRSRALAEGYDRHLTKPIEPEAFLAVVAEVAPADRRREPRQAAPAPSNGNGECAEVLVIEDDHDSGQGLKALLEAGGFHVGVARNGEEGIRMALSTPPGIALVDLGLPGLNGYEVAARLRRETGKRSLVLIAVSGYEEEEHRKRAFASGFDAYLVKPVRPDQLEEIIQQRVRQA